MYECTATMYSVGHLAWQLKQRLFLSPQLSPRTVATNDSSQNSGPRSSKEKNHTTQSQNHRVSSPALSNQESTSHRKSNQQIRTQSQNHNIVSPVERSHQESAPSRPVTHQHGASPLQNSTDQYTDLAVRIASFTGLWPHSTGKLTPKHMAVAGFYYAGDSSPGKSFYTIRSLLLDCWVLDYYEKSMLINKDF